MSDQYLRRYSLQVYAQTGAALELNNFRIRFRVRHADCQTPKSLFARITNVDDDLADQIQKEFTQVILQAGYEGVNFGTIFNGGIVYFRRGRENKTDTYFDILAVDGDLALNYGIINTTLRAGSSYQDQLNVAQGAFADKGVTAGYQTGIGPTQFPRGVVMFGMARDAVQNVADNNQGTWSVVDGQLQLVPKDGYLPGPATVFTSKTGMIGLPRLEPDGIHISAALNSNLRLGAQIQIDNKSIQSYLINVAYSAINYVPEVNRDGFYKVLVVDHVGDTRGHDWQTDTICIALDGSVPPALAAQLVA